MTSVTISHAVDPRPRVSRVLLSRIKNVVLGSDYELSTAFVNEARMRYLNRVYRGKSSSTDILSFSLSATSGEIVFCMKNVKTQAPLFKRSSSNFLTFLFIHGLLHLKGCAHGSRMEHEEEKIREKFNI